MRKAITAALLSGLVAPGVGHFYLKKYPVGLLLLAVSLGCIALTAYVTLEYGQQAVEQIRSGALQPDVTAMTDWVANQSAGAKGLWISGSGVVLLVTWLIGIVDAYRLGRKQDRAGR